jgi:hypothetical protein
MKKEFVTYEQALALKELGFDERCFSYYEDVNLYTSNGFNCNYGPIINGKEAALAPLIQQALRFFREKYGLISQITYDSFDKTFGYQIDSKKNIQGKFGLITYEEAEELCLYWLIKTAKENK